MSVRGTTFSEAKIKFSEARFTFAEFSLAFELQQIRGSSSRRRKKYAELWKKSPEKKERFIKEHSLTQYESNLLVSEKEISEYFEEVIKTSDKKLAKNWIIGDLFASLNEKNISLSEYKEFITIFNTRPVSASKGCLLIT